MGIVLYSGVVSEIKGKISGSVFQRGSTTTIIRNRGKVRSYSTPKQQLIHQQLQNLRRGWSLLSIANKNLWNDYAAIYTRTDKFGNERTISGYNWYISTNANLTLIGQSTIDQPATREEPTAVPSFTVLASATELDVDFGSAQDFSTDVLVLYISDQFTSGYKSMFSKTRFSEVMSDASLTLWNITGLWQNLYNQTWPPSNYTSQSAFAICLQRINKNSGLNTPLLCGQGIIS